jgi:NADH-quinone oxidoreductase subunit L
MFSIAPVSFAIIGIALAMMMYKKENELADKMSALLGRFYQSALHKFYIDELYLWLTKSIIFNLIGKPSAWFDKNIVDATMVQSAEQTNSLAGRLRFLQSGKLQDYMMYFFAALLLLFFLFVL